MSLVLWIIVLLFALALLILAAEKFTDSAERIGLYYGMPTFLVGVTIVAIGTSLPELASSLVAIGKGTTEFVAGNVIGSNIANILLVFGVVAIFHKSFRIRGIEKWDLPLFAYSVFVLLAFSIGGSFGFLGGVASILGLVAYFYFLSRYKKGAYDEHINEKVKKSRKLDAKCWLTLLFGVVFIWLGAQYTVTSVIEIAKYLNIGTEVISTTVVALGTSLPELFVSIVSIRKNNLDLATGNVLGSNLFNVFVVMGIPALFTTIVVPASMIMYGFSFLIFSSLAFFYIIKQKKTYRWHGVVFLSLYLLFIILMYTRELF